MKNINSKTAVALTLLSFGILLMLSCDKQIDDDHDYIPSDIHSFLNSKRTPPQSFTISAVAGGTIHGAGGTSVTFPPDAFSDEEDNDITGDVQISLKEIFTPADMIWNTVYTMSDDELLNSGGAYYINIMQDDIQLKMKEGKYYSLTMPAQYYSSDMQFFTGVENADGVNWNLVPPSPDSISYYDYFEYHDLENTYTILTDSIGWCNCDAFAGMPTADCSFHLTGTDGITSTNTIALAVVDELNSVYCFYGTTTLTESSFSEAGIGMTGMHLIVITIKGDDIYYGLLPFVPEEDETYTIEMQEATPEELDAVIADLE